MELGRKIIRISTFLSVERPLRGLSGVLTSATISIVRRRQTFRAFGKFFYTLLNHYLQINYVYDHITLRRQQMRLETRMVSLHFSFFLNCINVYLRLNRRDKHDATTYTSPLLAMTRIHHHGSHNDNGGQPQANDTTTTMNAIPRIATTME